MKKTILAAVALVLASSMPTLAQTYRSDVREYRQEERIERGFYRGRLTPREAQQLQRQQRRIDRFENRARARNGGYLSYRDQRRLERRQDRASDNIRRKTNNRRGWY